MSNLSVKIVTRARLLAANEKIISFRGSTELSGSWLNSVDLLTISIRPQNTRPTTILSSHSHFSLPFLAVHRSLLYLFVVHSATVPDHPRSIWSRPLEFSFTIELFLVVVWSHRDVGEATTDVFYSPCRWKAYTCTTPILAIRIGNCLIGNRGN